MQRNGVQLYKSITIKHMAKVYLKFLYLKTIRLNQYTQVMKSRICILFYYIITTIILTESEQFQNFSTEDITVYHAKLPIIEIVRIKQIVNQDV